LARIKKWDTDYGQEEPESQKARAELLVTFHTWRKRRLRKISARMEVGWIMVKSSKRVYR
jgi:hypothetical protein